jgi:hypothetical protein
MEYSTAHRRICRGALDLGQKTRAVETDDRFESDFAAPDTAADRPRCAHAAIGEPPTRYRAPNRHVTRGIPVVLQDQEMTQITIRLMPATPKV